MLRNLFVLILMLALCVPTVHAAANLPAEGVVGWIYDGDTFNLEGVGKVRLLGIDTPERKPSGRDRFYQRMGVDAVTLRKVSKAALYFVIKHAKGKRVTLAYDHETHDQYGRLLAYVYLPDGRLLNGLLLEEGLASVFRKYSFAMKEEFLELENLARGQGVGMWLLR